MKRTYTLSEPVHGDFRGERFSGEFSLPAGAVVASDPAKAELLEHLVRQGLARRGAVKSGPSPESEV